MKKILISMLVAISLQANTPTYDVNYKGMTLGEVTDLNTVHELYLKAKVTSRIARFLLGRDYLVYYSGDKPNIKKAKFKKDKKMMLYAFSQSLQERPAFKRYEISEIKNITLTCKGKACEFVYYKNNQVDGKGEILFDESDNFVSIKETMSDFEIVRK